MNDDWPYAVHCDCGWFGMSDDCRHNECPNCGRRVVRDRTETDDPASRFIVEAGL